MWFMGRKKKQKIDTTPAQAESPTPPPADKLGHEWWTKMPLREFKNTITSLTYEECVVLLETIRQSVREVTLRAHVEDMTPEQQKRAGRLAPIHRGCAEAVLVKIHAFQRPNKPLTD